MPSIWPKSKIPDIQVVENDISDNLYRMDFLFNKNYGRYFFLLKKINCEINFYPAGQNIDFFGNYSSKIANLKLK